MKNKNIEMKIKRAMFEKNINQTELAKKLGVTKAVISNWFTRKGNLAVETLEKIAGVLDVPVNYFMEQEENNLPCSGKNININLIMNLIEKQNKLIEEKDKKFEEKIKRQDIEINLLKEKINKFENCNK